jgi:hydrogenase expression/formation protein HypD
MKYVEEYRDAHLVRGVIDEIRRRVTRPWVLMEICGGQTHAIIRHGLDQLLPPEIELVHGPGCPVCVTPLELIDKALAIASQPGVIFASYGDMLRVPGSGQDLFSVRAAGGDVRVVYSPLDALKIAQQNPEKQVVFFAIGLVGLYLGAKLGGMRAGAQLGSGSPYAMPMASQAASAPAKPRPRVRCAGS